MSKVFMRAFGTSAEALEETRAYLQERVTLLFKLMFWSLCALMAFLAGTYAAFPADAPQDRALIYVAAGAGLGGMAFIWRVILVRKHDLSIATLYRLDLAYSFFIGLAFGLSAYVQSDLRPSGYLSVIYSTFTVFSRTLIVPSSWRRTLATSALTYTPMAVFAFVLAVQGDQDTPGPMYFLGFLLFSTAPIILATAGSYIIYGLRQKASAAKQLGLYVLDRKIGAGGMGTVYLAHHVLLRRPTAIKVIRPDDRTPQIVLDRFEREAQHTSTLTHPNTVAVYDYGRGLDGTFYYAMEYLGAGIDLDNLVRKHGPQPNDRVAAILAQVCGALHEAHVKQVIHRDIKPANIMLCERGGLLDIAKVLDFGLAKEFTANTGETGQVVLGTPAYIAPEAFTDPANVGPGVDLYAVAAVGYFLLTGQPVFKGKTAVDVCIQHVTKPVTPPSQLVAHAVQPELEAILMRCLAKVPGERPASALEVRDALLARPPVGDWAEPDMRAWWDRYRESERKASAAASAADAPTLTVRIDLTKPRDVKNA